MNTYLGIDYGGTKLIIGEVREDGGLLRYRRYPTGLTGQEEIAAHLLQCLDNYVAEEAPGDRIRGVGIGIVGISDFRNGIWHSVNHEEGIPIPLAQMAANRRELITMSGVRRRRSFCGARERTVPILSM